MCVRTQLLAVLSSEFGSGVAKVVAEDREREAFYKMILSKGREADVPGMSRSLGS